MTIGNLIHQTTYFNRLDVELLLSHLLSKRREYLYAHWSQNLSFKQIKQFQLLLNLRKKGQPMAYILGKKEFYGEEFFIKPGVFIPRPDTETIVSAVLKNYLPSEELKIIDFGCGCGCLGLILLKYFKQARLMAVDFDKKALELSQINAQNLGLQKRVQCLRIDISKSHPESLKNKLGKKADIIVANPPYIAEDSLEIKPHVRDFEPYLALFSSENGLYHIRSWFRQASELLKNRGDYFFEIGKGQNISFLESEVSCMHKRGQFYDLSKNIRVVQFRKCYG